MPTPVAVPQTGSRSPAFPPPRRRVSRPDSVVPAAVAALLCACASPSVPPEVLDESGASLWQRLETDHFVVESDMASTTRLRRIAGDFERLWHAFASVPVLGRQPPDRKSLVVVLRTAGEYHYLAPASSAGVTVPGTALGPLILIPIDSKPFGTTVIKHELAHFVSSAFLPNEPTWLHEGLAQVMETCDYDPLRGEILFGAHSADLDHSASRRVSWTYARIPGPPRGTATRTCMPPTTAGAGSSSTT